MSNKYLFLFYILFIFIYEKIYSKKVIIKNEEDFQNLSSILVNHQVDSELTVYFSNDYYDMTTLDYFSMDISVSTNLILIGKENGTVFDYKNRYKCEMIFSFYSEKENLLRFENIIFQNYYANGDGVQVVKAQAYTNNYQVQFYNCTIRNNDYPFMAIIHFDTSIEKTKPDVLFENCYFHDNTRRIVETYFYSPNRLYPNAYKKTFVKFYNCKFVNNCGIIYSHYSTFVMENCYISGLQKDIEYNSVVFYFSKFSYNYFLIKNSVIENIKVKTPNPLINSDNLIFEVENTVFSNCTTEYGFLFNIRNHFQNQYIRAKNITVSNSDTMFHGDYTNNEISDSVFKDITLKNSIPGFSDSKYSTYNITNTIFKNINIVHALMGGESKYILNNIKLDSIKTNSKAVLNFVYNDIYIDNMEANSISCVGDGGDTSFILFNSGENKKFLSINNSLITNSSSNGSFIKLLGDTNDFILKNTNVSSIFSYGPIIENTSKKSNITISNINFYNNINNNKLECGNIHFSNDLNISISNSIFYKNNCKSSGGAICINDVSNMNLTLTSNSFENNKSINGGALYIKNENNNENNENNNIIKIEDNIFENNIAENFGGALYSEYNQFYIAKTKKNKFIDNNAGIMGGGIYSPNTISKNLFNLKNSIFINNTVNGYINDYTSEPSYILVDRTIKKDYYYTITTGEHFPLIFTLYDEFNNIIEDITKYYSSLSIKIELEKIDDTSSIDKTNYNTKETFYNLNYNICSFIKGKCELNNLQIFAKPNLYSLKINIENYNRNIDLKFNTIKIKVTSCEENQIIFYDKDKILYCENPICDESCPVDVSAICKPYYKELINDAKLNNCTCLDGWNGDHCENRIFVNYREKRIIKDTGYFKILIFSVGILFALISEFFATYESFNSCWINFLFKNIGNFLIIIILYIYVISGSKLGIKNRSDNKYKLVSSDSLSNEIKNSNNIPNNIYDENSNESLIKKNDQPKACSDEEINQRIELKLLNINLAYSNSMNDINKYTNKKNLNNIYLSEKSSKKNLNNKRNNLNRNNNKNINDSYNKLLTNMNKSMNMNTNINTSMNESINDYTNNINNSNNNNNNDTNSNNNYYNNNKNNKNKNKNNKKPNFISKMLSNTSTRSLDSNTSNPSNPSKRVIKNIKQIHTLVFEALIVFPILLFFLIMFMLHAYFKEYKYKNHNEDLYLKKYIFQNKDGNWSYKCELENINFVCDLINLTVYTVIIIYGRKVLNYECVFKCTKCITYSSFIGIFLCPLVNILGYALLQSQRYERVWYENGDNPLNYIKYTYNEKCPIHYSYECGCMTETSNDKKLLFINKYIQFYTFCSTVYKIENGKMKLIKKKSKIDVLFLE
ncbi:hypothetical protein BCR32DRAFT_292364 [Anaeromyces robustus]|uniref:EGF-like domain-containing protein n=1 Tax=Anaeromyces robustus TaxID=1754192 RepID=A0A1Y1XBR0_9FUNG|nr:hypothetical protein BCR32DRAFT_292364 [Anaeromyces robustus]|eukprot:ORX82804.1 hypothetical protein BCR32DRAFT_292364 [Anaeromyces robustus]